MGSCPGGQTGERSGGKDRGMLVEAPLVQLLPPCQDPGTEDGQRGRGCAGRGKGAGGGGCPGLRLQLQSLWCPGMQSRLSEQRYIFTNACLGRTRCSFADTTLCSPNLPVPSSAPQAVSGSPRAGHDPGQCQGSCSLQHLQGGWQLASGRGNVRTRGGKGPGSTNSGCCGLWGQAGRACGQGRFISIVLLGSAVLRWGGWERVAVSFLSALISMVTRGTRGPGLKYALPPVLPSG